MLKHTDKQVKGEEEVSDLRDQEAVRFELERMHEPVSQMEVQRSLADWYPST